MASHPVLLDRLISQLPEISPTIPASAGAICQQSADVARKHANLAASGAVSLR